MNKKHVKDKTIKESKYNIFNILKNYDEKEREIIQRI